MESKKINNILECILDLTNSGIETGEEKYFSMASRLLRFLKSETGKEYDAMTEYVYTNWEENA